MKKSAKKRGRRSPWASVALLGIGLAITGGGYTIVSQTASAAENSTSASPSSNSSLVKEGAALFSANCATCHGTSLEGTAAGPSLIGVGAASVDFQVSTGRMPLANQGAQAPTKPVQFTNEQISALAAFVASTGAGPAVPDDSVTSATGDAAHGAQLFRTNCAMCHNVAGAGGALTEGKYAPALNNVDARQIYEAMITGPQNMPVFSDTNLSPSDKQDIITYLMYIRENPSPGGIDLGNLGPVAEGLFLWIFGLGTIVAFTIWLASKSN